MIGEIISLDIHQWQELAAAIRSGRIKSPFTPLALQRVLAPTSASHAAIDLNRLVAMGISQDACRGYSIF